MTDVDLTFVDEAVERIGTGREGLIPILQALQGRYGWLPEEALERICQRTEITPADVSGVSTFYDQFRHRPVGEHVVHVCIGTACHVKGAEAVLEAVRNHLAIPAGDDTDPDGRFTIQKVACMGCCTLAPVARIDDVTYGHLTPDSIPGMLEDFLQQEAAGARHARRRPPAAGDNLPEIRVGLGSCCVASGSGRVREAIEDALVQAGAQAAVRVKRVGCVGMCHQTPLVEVVPPDGPAALYARVQEKDARKIVFRHFRPRGIVRRISARTGVLLENLLTDETWEPITRYGIEVRDPPVAAFLGPQRHLATEFCGVMDPTDMAEYRRRDGFEALRTCLTEWTPGEIIGQIRASGLRGRGGAGFLTGLKWQRVRKATGEPKYIVCNGDEGDPGAFMDRMLLESYPYRIIEGMIIAAYAVGASEGRFYIRAEYPLAVLRIDEALQRCRQEGLLGDDILGRGFSLHLRIMQGAGAFVCGEETALLASIEGRRGMPRLRPPYPAESGLHGKPTLVNNVETYSLVPWILRHGPEAFAELGTETSKGTKVFALAGKIRRGGLIEVPMGVTLRQVVEEIGGGIAGGKRFKAVQVGGPSGGCVPERLSDTPVDYEALTAVGAMMGSGGLVVLDETDCMVDIARYFLSFTQDQSCGKCTFCRIGTHHMLDILTRLCGGQGVKGDLEQLADLARSVKQGSLCGLGKTAPNPVLSTLEYFRDEYEAHLEGRCPAGVCKALITYSITDDCFGCTKCAQVCPSGAIAFRPHEQHEIDAEKCIRCGACKQICPVDAVTVE
ncbi:MAG TPA: NADH-quinone oxidoreductase subunit NuoE [Phycisphaerae bacterium]|nr:NADH-quinone oxidoreductase subunit NuoE [Phycisphaerae bacterium]